MTAPIKMDFVIDEDYLITHALTHFTPSEKAQEDIRALRNKAGKISPNGYDYLQRQLLYPGIYTLEDQEAQDLIVALKKLVEFQAILDQTKANQGRIEQEWNANLERSFEFMQEMTNLPLDNSYTVFVTHPSLPNGRYLGSKQIAWGSHPSIENHNAVYLWHEILHDDENLGTDGRVGHALIELLSDNALRVHLNGENLEKLIGHSFLNRIRGKIYADDWQQYITSSEKDILKFKTEMEEKYKQIAE